MHALPYQSSPMYHANTQVPQITESIGVKEEFETPRKPNNLSNSYYNNSPMFQYESSP
jgi:hypothetical protein